jgi:hypothetical protein
MKTFEELTNLERSILLIWGKSLDFSTTAHYPDQRIKRKLTSSLPEVRTKDINRASKTLITSGFILEKPTRRNTTYSLSIEGLRCCNILREKLGI